jgi:hypothetical protein
MALKPGTLDDFDDSMAAAIELVFESLWEQRHDIPLPEEGRDDRRMLYVSIAQGVLNHLRDHASDGFVVEVVQNDGNEIDSSGMLGTTVINVRQAQLDSNKVRCTGTIELQM